MFTCTGQTAGMLTSAGHVALFTSSGSTGHVGLFTSSRSTDHVALFTSSGGVQATWLCLHLQDLQTTWVCLHLRDLLAKWLCLHPQGLQAKWICLPWRDHVRLLIRAGPRASVYLGGTTCVCLPCEPHTTKSRHDLCQYLDDGFMASSRAQPLHKLAHMSSLTRDDCLPDSYSRATLKDTYGYLPLTYFHFLLDNYQRDLLPLQLSPATYEAVSSSLSTPSLQ